MSARLSLASIGLMLQKYVILFSLIILCGCGINSDRESIVDISHIKNMKPKSLVKLSEISKQDWNLVCIVMAYPGSLASLEQDGDKRIEAIESKLIKLDLAYKEGYWHLMFEREGEVIVNSFKRSSEIDVKNTKFTPDQMRIFSHQHFKPSKCVERPQAYFYKFKESEANNPNYIVLGELQK
jgi:hypothetical protein